MTTPELRSLSEQTVDELGGAGSVLARQRQDHVRLDQLLQRLTGTTGREQDEVLTDVCRLVFPHAFAEEAVLWPAVRRALPDGEQLTLRIEQEHQQINELTSTLERTASDDPARPARVRRLVELLHEDVRDEEDVLLPRLQQALSHPELVRLGRSWQLARATAPTRPHPTVARRPPGNALAALPLTVLDRTRDLLDRTARRGPAPVQPAARAASRLLATAAGAVERVPVLQRGEDRSTRAPDSALPPEGAPASGRRGTGAR
jgi:hemerythrin superfamily protein